MSAIGPGDFVECVSGDARGALVSAARTTGDGPYVGSVYRVRRLIIGAYADGTTGRGVMLHEVRAWNDFGVEGGWPLEYFRPVYRPKADLIESLTTKAPELEPA